MSGIGHRGRQAGVSDGAQAPVVCAKASAAGEFEIHADSCTGPLLARLPLAPALRGRWALARVAFSHIGGTHTAGHQRLGKNPT